MYWEPIGGLSSSPRILNATFTELIRFCIAFLHRLFLFTLSKAKAASTVLGTLIPNLYIILRYLLLTAAMILCLFLRYWLSTRRMQGHHLIPLLLHILQPQQGMTLSCHSIFHMRLTFLSTLCKVPILLWFSVSCSCHSM